MELNNTVAQEARANKVNKIIYAIKQIGYMRALKRVVPSGSTIHKYTLTQELKENTDINIINNIFFFIFNNRLK